MKKKTETSGKQGLFTRKKALSVHVTAALMAAPLSVMAAPPDTPPVQGQTETKTGIDQPAGTDSTRLLEQQPSTAFTRMQQEFPGLAWGSFLAFPELVLATTYDDNIYGQRRNVIDDAVFTLSPSLQLKSNWDRHALNFNVGADLDRYLNHHQENVNDAWAGFDGRYDLTPRGNIFGGARFSHDHEDRSSPDNPLDPALRPTEPTVFDHGEAHLGYAGSFGKLRVRAGVTFDQYNFKDGISATGINLDNDFRNRQMHSLGVRTSYVYSPNYEFFAQYATDTRNYENNISAVVPFNRDSDGYRLAAGLKFRHPSKALAGEVFAGTLHQKFDYDGFSDVSKPYFGALVSWRPSSLLRVSGFIDRSLEETTVYLVGPTTLYASSSLDTTYGFEAERRLSGKLTLNGRAAYTHSQYQGIDRLDKIIDAGAGLRYYVTPVVFVGTDLRVIDRDSDAQLAQYSRNQIMLNVGYTPARKRDYSIIPEEAGAAVATNAPGLYSGFYLGAQIGQGGLMTATSGSRGGGGLDEADMGAIGETYGLFAGWGTEISRWYLGAELDASDSGADWSHSKDKPDSRTMYVNKNTGYGLSARLGYILDGGLLYGKLGLVRTNFDTYCTENQYAPAGAYSNSRNENGVRWGVGLEIPASSNLFVRMDYSFTNYGSYAVPYQSGDAPTTYTTEAFDTSDSLFSLGLGWRFGGERPAVAKRPPTDLRGFYAGASFGHGILNTTLTGTQMESNPTPPPDYQGPYNYYGDFASPGFAGGFFAGYGYTFDHIYAGLELETGAANFGWYHLRDTAGGGGRDFSVEKRGSYGASLRLGYVLQNGSLLYGRIGAVKTRFNTIYNKGAGSGAWIDRTDRLSGTRIGLGAEIPASRTAFVRMDYTYTRYDSYGFVTTNAGGANPDDMQFDNHESLARLGLGFRF